MRDRFAFPDGPMPSALTSSPVDHTVFPSGRRGVWSAPEVQSHALAVLTATRLALTPVGVSVPEGVDPEAVVDLDGRIVELASVRRVRLDLLTNAVIVEPEVGEAAIVKCATAETADAVYSALWRRLGERVELAPYRLTPGAALREPAGVMLGVLVATAILAVGATVAEDTWPTSLLASFDWRWVCGAGGAMLALAQVWCYRRLTRPPVRLELVRR